MQVTPIMSLHYFVKHKFPKTNNIYEWAERLMVNFKVSYLTEMLIFWILVIVSAK